MPIKDIIARRDNHARYMREVWYPKNNQTPEVRSRLMVRNEVKNGRLAAVADVLCEECGGTDHVQSHHDDHERPLDVKRLCIKCHREREAGRPTGEALGS